MSTSHRRRLSAARRLSAWLLVFGLMATWSLAMPLMASPDEPSHAVKAAAVVRGQLAGPLGPVPDDPDAPGAPTFVQVPADIAAAASLSDCFRFDSKKTADCAPRLPVRGRAYVTAVTYAGQYPPTYYALVGLPSVVLSGSAAFSGMRLLSAALCAFFVVWGLRRLHVTIGPVGLWGAAVGLTPMCLFLGGSVNPNGFEIATAFSFWAACLALVRRSTPPRAAFVQVAVSGLLLATTRTSGPVWSVLTLGLALACAWPGVLVLLARRRIAWWTLGAITVGIAATGAWILVHDGVVTTTGGHDQFASPRLVVVVMLLATEAFIKQMTGNFGWLDTPAPYPTVLAWQAAASVLVLLALAVRGRRRPKAALLATIGAVVLVPIVLTLATARAAGIVWQGRYTLPLAVGVPLVAAALLAEIHGPLDKLLDRLGALTIGLLAFGHVSAFYWAARRYALGSGGGWLSLHPSWSSPLGFLPAVMFDAAVVAIATVVLLRTLHRQKGRRAEADDAPHEFSVLEDLNLTPSGEATAAGTH